MRSAAFFAASSGIVGLASAASTTAAPAASGAASGSKATTSGLPASINPNSLCIEKVAGIDGCGLPLILGAGSTSFGCAQTDLVCQCNNFSAVQSAIFNPVLSACGATRALQVQSGAQALCECVSYTGDSNVPPSVQISRTTANINPNGNKLCVSYGLAIPTCGTAVLQSIGYEKYGCGNYDFQCQCAHIKEIQPIASTPIINVCGTTTGLLVESAADQLCSCITANNKGLPSPTGDVPTVPTYTTSRADAAGRSSFSPLTGFAGILSVFSGIIAMF